MNIFDEYEKTLDLAMDKLDETDNKFTAFVIGKRIGTASDYLTFAITLSRLEDEGKITPEIHKLVAEEYSKAISEKVDEEEARLKGAEPIAN